MVIDADELPVKIEGDRPSDYAVRMAASTAAPLIESGGTVRVVTTGGGQIRTSWTETIPDLAQIEDQTNGTASRWIEDINVGERVLAFVHSSNSELLSSLSLQWRTRVLRSQPSFSRGL
jgi:hypothetical protein